jgi:polar amino acid transport system substrate-binding protein
MVDTSRKKSFPSAYVVQRWRLVALLWLWLCCLSVNYATGHELNSHEVAPGVFHVHELTIAVSCAEPPYYKFDGIEGREWELVSTAFSNAGHKARLYYLDAAEGFSALEKGMVDAVWVCCNMQVPPDGYYLSAPLLPRQIVAITLASNNLQIETVEDLAGKTVALHPSLHATMEQEIKRIIAINPLVQSVSNHELLAMFLYSGRIEVLISERGVFDYHRQRVSPRTDTEQPVVFHEIFPVQYPRLVFRDQVLRDEFDTEWKKLQGRKDQESVRADETPASVLNTDIRDATNTP